MTAATIRTTGRVRDTKTAASRLAAPEIELSPEIVQHLSSGEQIRIAARALEVIPTLDAQDDCILANPFGGRRRFVIYRCDARFTLAFQGEEL